MGDPEVKFQVRRALEECALPAAPMAMPEQRLSRQRFRGVFMRPLFQWLALR